MTPFRRLLTVALVTVLCLPAALGPASNDIPAARPRVSVGEPDLSTRTGAPSAIPVRSPSPSPAIVHEALGVTSEGTMRSVATGTPSVSGSAAASRKPSPVPHAAHRPAVAASRAPRRTQTPLRASARPQAATGPVLRGYATWYGTGGPGTYAAMGGYRDGERVVAVVSAFHDGRTYSVTVPVVTQCGACRWRSGATLVDLSVPAWNELGWPLSRGVIPVQVQLVEGSVG